MHSTRGIKAKGFTLVEILIVLVIAGIISATAFPAYKTYLLEQRRTDALQALQDSQIKIFEFLLYNDNLPDSNTSSQIMSDLGILSESSARFYTITMPTSEYNSDNNTYKVIATAIGKQSQDIDCPLVWISDKYPLPNPRDCR